MTRDLLGPISPACLLTAVALPELGAVGEAVGPVLEAAQGTVGSLGVAPQQPPPAQAAPPPAPGAPPPAAALAQPVAPALGPPLPQFSPFSVGLFRSAVPNYNYLNMLVGRPGSFGQLQSGLLNTNLFGTASSGSLAAPDPAASDVAAAGNASPLPTSGAERVALPVLVAVLMLATVAAALIRSWVVVTRR